MAYTTKGIYYPDVDQAGYEEQADVPANMKTMAESVDTALGDIDLSTCEKLANKTTTINSSSTDIQYPSALAVYTYVNTIVGDIGTALDTINGESVGE